MVEFFLKHNFFIHIFPTSMLNDAYCEQSYARKASAGFSAFQKWPVSSELNFRYSALFRRI